MLSIDWLLVRLTTILVTLAVTLTLYFLYRLPHTKQTKTSEPDFHQSCIVWPSNLLIFLLTYGQTLRRIFQIEIFYVYISRFPWNFLHYPTQLIKSHKVSLFNIMTYHKCTVLKSTFRTIIILETSHGERFKIPL